ncbi:hypothetical protein EBZ39_05670 [bacterium]|nr:hypothetical protein [bacterium]
MIIAELLLNIVSEGIKYLNESEGREIRERILKLREGMRNELSKGSVRDDALVDSIESELLDISKLYLARITQASPKD